MHLLAAQPGGISDGVQAVDLDQSPGDVVVLSAADSDLASLVAARDLLYKRGEGPQITEDPSSTLNLSS